MPSVYTTYAPPSARQSAFAIREVLMNADLNDFLSFPATLYNKSTCYVPPLKTGEKATFKKWGDPAFGNCESRYWLAYKNGKVAGRIAGIINHEYINKWDNRYVRFGWFDVINDQAVADALLQRVEDWAKEKDMGAVHGPMGFCQFNPAGMLVEGFEELPTVAELYNYRYYPALMEGAGYQKEVDWVSYEINIPNEVPVKIAQLSRIVKTRYQLTVLKPKNSLEIKHQARSIFNLINTCYRHLHGVVHLTEQQIQFYTDLYLSYTRKDFISLVANRHGALIAAGISLPSLSRAFQKAKGDLFPLGLLHILYDLYRSDRVDLCLVAIHPDYQGKGVNAILMAELNTSFLRNNIKVAESNPELETNARVQALWKYYKSRQHKRRRSYIKHLT